MRCRRAAWGAIARTGGIATALAVALVTVAGCRPAGDEGQSARALPPAVEVATTTTAAPVANLVARAEVPSLAVYAAPGDATPVRTLANPRPSAMIGSKSPLVLLVSQERGEWLEVLLPVRPNGTTGWIRKADVTIDRNQFKILVEIGSRRITVWDGDDLVLHEPVAVGTSSTPTPVGRFYTTELLKPVGQPAYGPYAFALSAFSTVHMRFAGGDGIIGIHGTNAPGLLGSSVSNGCIRMSNAAITRLAEALPPSGVPVEIRQ